MHHTRTYLTTIKFSKVSVPARERLQERASGGGGNWMRPTARWPPFPRPPSPKSR